MARQRTVERAGQVREERSPAMQLAAYLAPGERLQWSSRPGPRIYALSKARPAFYGALIVALWLAGLVVTLLQSGAAGRWELLPYTLLFLAPGLWLLSTPLRLARHARGIAYGITDRRIMIAAERPRRALLSFAPDDIQFLQRFDYADGSASLFFRHEVPRGSAGRNSAPLLGRIGFFGIRDPDGVEARIRGLAGDRLPQDSGSQR